MDIENVDIIFGLQWGDEGKGKITNAISKKYDYICRFNGGPNAGHTIYINNKKYKTHIIPCGVFSDKPSVIGPNCVVNIEKFFDEIDYLKKHGFNTNLIKVSPKANVITERHIIYDRLFLKKKLGTTGQGIAPAYSDKMLRIGKLAKYYLEEKYIWDSKLKGSILCEGAQSFWLDVNYGDYPYVTSSETLPYSACSLGFSPKKIRDIIGIAKIYDTKSGIDPLFPESLWQNEELNLLINIGQEFGTTTGRRRIANWLNLNKLIYALKISGTTRLIINKCDILNMINIYKLYYNNILYKFDHLQFMQSFIKDKLNNELSSGLDITFSGNKEFI